MKLQKDMHTTIFTAALFTIARTWNQSRCPSTDEWIKLWYMYTMEYCSTIKSYEFELVELRRVNLEPVIRSEVSQRKTNIIY